jgi:hypothetical protein
MKQNNNNRRPRGRGPRKPHGMGGGGGHNKNQGYEGGQELRVRGNAYQVLEKYLQLARDAGSAGDRVAAENFLQHADHYYRVLSAMNDGQRPRAGGRELSVADVNVQNVSQGLSAALYSSGGPNPQGVSDSDLQGDGMQGQNPGNQGGQGHGAPSHNPGQGGHRQGGHQHGGHQGRQQGGHQQGGHQQGGHQQGGHQQGARSQADAQSQNPQAAADGNVAPTNGRGNTYDNYVDRTAPQPTYVAPVEPARTAPQPTVEEQPDYPEELLAPAAAPAAPVATDEAEEGVQRTLRTPRARLRGPGRRGPRQGQTDGRQGEPRPPEGPAESGE